MKTVLIVLGALTAVVLLPLIALPLLAAAGVGLGIAAVVGGAALFAIPLAIGVAILGVVGLVLRLVFGLVGLVFSVIGAIVGALFAVLLLPFVLLPVILPALLIGGLVWWAVRASRPTPKALPAPATV